MQNSRALATHILLILMSCYNTKCNVVFMTDKYVHMCRHELIILNYI